MKIREILRDDFELNGDIAGDINGIDYNSKKVSPGDLFVAIKGENSDGHDFIEDALQKGAISVVYQKGWAKATFFMYKYPKISWIGATDTRDAIAYLSARFYHNPSRDIALIGITGTNGKTTTSYIIKNILEKCGYDTGLVGTIGHLIKDKVFTAFHTTPEAPDFQRLLRTMADEGCKYVVSEVSSHALSQKRVDYSRFMTAIFTNLTQDHLDFHLTMENYYKSKKRLFTELLDEGGCAVINIDNPYGERLLGELKKSSGNAVRYITYSIDSPTADLKALSIKMTYKGLSFTLGKTELANGVSGAEIRSGLIGRPNVYNLLAGIGSALSLGMPMELIKEAIGNMSCVNGRFDRVEAGQDFLAIVDYAHTEDALVGLLNTARQLIQNGDFKKKTDIGSQKKPFAGRKIITIFGCGGNRDRGKRAKMAQAATRLSDYVIMTTDNPRFEDPLDILFDMEKGAMRSNYMIIPDRTIAIQIAVEMASSGDILLVAGKGHENYQEIRGVRSVFCDKTELAKTILRNKGNKGR